MAETIWYSTDHGKVDDFNFSPLALSSLFYGIVLKVNC